MYVPVKGGQAAIAASREQVARARRGNPDVPELSIEQIREQMGLSVDRVITEGSLYDRDLAALALKQAQGDIAEAVFLLRAHRATLPHFGRSRAIDLRSMEHTRRISATNKELPGGQLLGATYDYTHRLLDFSLMTPQSESRPQEPALISELPKLPVLDAMADSRETMAGVDEPATDAIDITRTPTRPPYAPSEALAHLVRGDEGFLTGLAYSRLRKAGAAHPYVADLSAGPVEVVVDFEDIGISVSIGEIEITTCSVVAPVLDGAHSHLSSGFGLSFGRNERKAVSMATIDQAMKSGLDPEHVLAHCDGVEASGYVSHLKLPHYADFQSDLEAIRKGHGQP